MKKTLLALLLLLSSACDNQYVLSNSDKEIIEEIKTTNEATEESKPVAQEIIKEETNGLTEAEAVIKNFQDSKLKSFNIEMLEGLNTTFERTSVEYEPLAKQLIKIKAKANDLLWTNEDLEKNLDLYLNNAVGGIVSLSIKRLTIAAANTEYFTIIIKDLNEKELFRENLKNKIPEIPGDDRLWTNFKTSWIDSKININDSFYIYVIDNLLSKKYKFKMTPNT